MLTTVLSMLRYVSGSRDRDFVDRMHSYFTVNILIGLSVLVSFKQFGGKPIECLTPDIFSGSWEEYAENYCWAQDTYSVLMHETVDAMPQSERHHRRISYYQWVPFFLLLEAACFRLPSILWKYMSGHSGIKIQEIVKLSSDPNNIKPDIKRANIKSLTTHLQGALRFHRRLSKKQIRPHRLLCMLNLPYSACFVTVMYMTTKFCYLLNVLFQLVLMNKFLETDKYQFYGFGAIKDMLAGKTWETSGIFPRVTLCDFQVRVMGNLQQHTIQCVLVINIFNEKIFIFLWFWFSFLLLFTCGSFLYWLIIFIIPYPNRRFIRRHIEMSEIRFHQTANGDEEYRLMDGTAIKVDEGIRRFIDHYLRADGIFVIRMLTLHSGVIFGTDLVQELWRSYFGADDNIKRSNSFPDLIPMASEDQTDIENVRNSLRQRRAPYYAIRPMLSRRHSREHDKLIPPPPPPEAVLRRLQRAMQSRNNSITSIATENGPITHQRIPNNLPTAPLIGSDPSTADSSPHHLQADIIQEEDERSTGGDRRDANGNGERKLMSANGSERPPSEATTIRMDR